MICKNVKLKELFYSNETYNSDNSIDYDKSYNSIKHNLGTFKDYLNNIKPRYFRNYNKQYIQNKNNTNNNITDILINFNKIILYLSGLLNIQKNSIEIHLKNNNANGIINLLKDENPLLIENKYGLIYFLE